MPRASFLPFILPRGYNHQRPAHIVIYHSHIQLSRRWKKYAYFSSLALEPDLFRKTYTVTCLLHYRSAPIDKWDIAKDPGGLQCQTQRVFGGVGFEANPTQRSASSGVTGLFSSPTQCHPTATFDPGSVVVPFRINRTPFDHSQHTHTPVSCPHKHIAHLRTSII